MPPCSMRRASGNPRSPQTTARSIRRTTPTYILAFHRDPSQTQASRRSTPPSNPPKPGTSSTSRTPRVTTTTPRPTKSSAASSSSTASSRSAGRLLLLGGEPGGEPAVSLYKAGFAAAGIEASCEVRTVAATELADAIARIRADRSVLGAAVTMPHTVAASRLLDGLGPEAQVIKAVNTISHRAGALIGWNTDRPAFSLALEDAGFQAKGRSVLALGAGGAARAWRAALRQPSPGTRGAGAGRPGHQRVDDAALPGAGRLRNLDRSGPAGGGDAGGSRTSGGGASQAVNHLLLALAWAVVGGAAGTALNYLTRWLARIEEIEFRQSMIEWFLMPALAAILFFLFALQLGIRPLLFINTIYV